jgi:hypothetical protein
LWLIRTYAYATACRTLFGQHLASKPPRFFGRIKERLISDFFQRLPQPLNLDFKPGDPRILLRTQFRYFTDARFPLGH